MDHPVFTTIRNLFHTFMFHILKSAYLYSSGGGGCLINIFLAFPLSNSSSFHLDSDCSFSSQFYFPTWNFPPFSDLKFFALIFFHQLQFFPVLLIFWSVIFPQLFQFFSPIFSHIFTCIKTPQTYRTLVKMFGSEYCQIDHTKCMQMLWMFSIRWW